eukprot:SAG22_NODE_2356_length_2670_cov_6.978996_1_plen_338_part_00
MAESQPAWASDPKVYAEVVSFAEYLGFDTNEHPDLLWIAEQARSAPLPEPWTEHTDDAQDTTYYYNPETQESIWEHPLDEYFKNLYERHKAMKTSPDATGGGDNDGGCGGSASDLSGRRIGYQGSASTSRLLQGKNGGGMAESWDEGGADGAATVHNMGGGAARAGASGGNVDFSLVERLEQERSRTGPPAGGNAGRPMRYTGSRSDVVLSGGWQQGGDNWGGGAGVAGVTAGMQRLTASESNVAKGGAAGAAGGGNGFKSIGATGKLQIDEAELLGYGSNGERASSLPPPRPAGTANSGNQSAPVPSLSLPPRAPFYPLGRPCRHDGLQRPVGCGH